MKTSRTLFTLLVVLALSPFARSAAASAIQGQWIWTSAAANERNAYSYFRRSFTLPAVPKSAVARVAADSMYVLTVNGRRVGRGSARSHTAWTYYDTWDITPYLVAGPNVVAALVHHAGEWTMQRQAGKAGFLCDISAGDTSIRTDGAWKAVPSTAWDPKQERRNRALGFVECFDARQEPAGWTTAAFDDSAWPKAVELGPAGAAPWTHLTPSPIPPPVETVLAPKGVVDVLAVEPPADAGRIRFAELYDRPAWAVGYAATYLHASRAMQVTLQTGSDDALKLWVNGDLVLSQPAERPGGPGQDTVEARLRPGWNRVLAKSVKRLGPWQFFFAMAGPNADEVAISSEKDLAQENAWRISPVYPFDAAKSIAPGYDTAFAPEKKADETGWRLVKAPQEPLNVPSTVMHHEARTRVDPPQVQGADGLANGGAAEITSKRGRDGAVVLDFGREVLGYPRVTVKGARGGEIVDLGYAEALEGPDGQPVSPATGAKGVLNPERGTVRYADRFICRPGDNTFETFEKKGFRYMQVDIRKAARPVTLADVSVTLSIYPVQERGAFQCSDDRLNRIWETARWTLRLNMDDAYTDCPWRERAQWFGDARVEALSNYYAFGDAVLMRQALVQGAQSQDAEGIIHGIYPTDWDGTRMPSFALLWVPALWEYTVYTGDTSMLKEMLPVLDRQFAFFEKRRNADGLPTDVPYWVFIDWGEGMDGQRVGVSASLNAMYFRALQAASDIARAAGDSARAQLWAQKAAGQKAAFNRVLWSDGVYQDQILNGKPVGHTSEQVAALAVAFGLAPLERWSAVLDAASTQADSVKIGTPYFGAFWLDALHAAGRDQEALDYIRTRWGRMLDWGATTFWEFFDPKDSLCHGWSTAPLRDLPARTLGLRPTKPGWREFEFAPAFCDLNWAKGTVPTPLGDVKASWTRDGATTRLALTVPQGAAAVVRVPGKASWTVNGGPLPAGVKAVPFAGGWSVRIDRPGEYAMVGKGTP